MLVDRINLEPGEEVQNISRRHKFLLLAEAVGLLFVALIPCFLYFFIVSSEQIPYPLEDYTAVFVYFYAVWLLFVWVAGFTAWTDYYLDILVITNHRLIITNQKGFFRRSIASFRLERLQEINVEVDGFLATLLDFGSLQAETAGHGRDEFHMSNLPDPQNLKALIMKAVESRPDLPYNQTN